VRIGIVNDLAIAREALRRAVEGRGGHRVSWVAHDGAEAVARCRSDRPDLVLMDLVMPVMDGVEATRAIMRQAPCAILVVTSSVRDNASLVFRAMAAGALDAVDTPTVGNDDGSVRLMSKVQEMADLVAPRAGACAASVSGRNGGAGVARAESRAAEGSPPTPGPSGWGRPPILAIGSSTGGPGALAQVLAALPADLGAPIVIAQHVDARFATGLAEWLAGQARRPVRIAREGDLPAPGAALLAGTNDHLVLGPDLRFAYRKEPVAEPYRPSVNVLFDSLARHWPRDGVALLLTGMGRDGASGLLTLRQLGWHTIVQDEASSVVYGMPRAAVELGAAVEVLPVEQIGEAARRALASKAPRSSP